MKKVLTSLAVTAASLIAVSTAQAQSGGLNEPIGSGAVIYQAVQAGALEAPPNLSPGNGITRVDLVRGTTLVVDEVWKDLTGGTVGSHIHCCTSAELTGTAPIAIPFPDFPQNVTTGSYLNSFDLTQESTYDPAFLASNGGTASGAMTAFLAGVNANQSYVNIHTTDHPEGEIRGWLVAAPIPEPGSWAMLGVGLAGLGFMARRRSS